MDNKINNNVSFQAKLVTSLKGRNNIMEPVKKEFAKITKNIDGEFHIKRPLHEFPAKDHYVKMSYQKAFMITDALQPLLSKDYSRAGKQEVRELAQKLATNFKVLMAENTYINNTSKIKKDICDTNLSIQRAEHYKRRAERYKLTGLIGRYDSTIEDYKKSLSKLQDKIKVHQKRLIKKMEPLQEKGVGLELYTDVLKDEFRVHV